VSKSIPPSWQVMNWRNKTKRLLIAYKGGRCESCGYCKDVPSVYEFHHKFEYKKEFLLSDFGHSLNELKKEADKCSLLCSNCHRELHYRETETRRNDRLSTGKKNCRKFYKEIQCSVCGKIFKPKSKTQVACCKKHRDILMRKANRPARRTLGLDMKKMTWVDIGRKYGVSDNAARKWAAAYSLL